MSSGLRFRAPLDPDFDPEGSYPDHKYVYTSSDNTFKWSATRPQQWPPNTVGRYRNCDPNLINYLIRLAVEGRGEAYWNFHIPGILLVYALYGIFHRWLTALITRFGHAPLIIFLYLLTLLYLEPSSSEVQNYLSIVIPILLGAGILGAIRFSGK